MGDLEDAAHSELLPQPPGHCLVCSPVYFKSSFLFALNHLPVRFCECFCISIFASSSAIRATAFARNFSSDSGSSIAGGSVPMVDVGRLISEPKTTFTSSFSFPIKSRKWHRVSWTSWSSIVRRQCIVVSLAPVTNCPHIFFAVVKHMRLAELRLSYLARMDLTTSLSSLRQIRKISKVSFAQS